MRGVRVLVRAFGDEARICRVVEKRGESVYLTDEEGFSCIERGENTEKMTIFRLDDLYEYVQTVKSGDRPDWGHLTPFRSCLTA